MSNQWMDALRRRATVAPASPPTPCGPHVTTLQMVLGTTSDGEERINSWVVIDKTKWFCYLLINLQIISSKHFTCEVCPDHFRNTSGSRLYNAENIDRFAQTAGGVRLLRYQLLGQIASATILIPESATQDVWKSQLLEVARKLKMLVAEVEAIYDDLDTIRLACRD